MKTSIVIIAIMLLGGCSSASKNVPIVHSPAIGPIWAADSIAASLMKQPKPSGLSLAEQDRMKLLIALQLSRS